MYLIIPEGLVLDCAHVVETVRIAHLIYELLQCLAKSYASLRLQLNPSKTEFIWFGSRTNLLKIPSSSRSLQVCDSVVDCSEVVRDLGVFFDSEMSMKHHVSKTASACFYHIRRLRQIRHLVSREVLTQLVTSLVWTIVTPFLPAFPRRR